MDFKAFAQALEPFQSIGLTAPAWADGDSIGTQAAMREALALIFPKKRIRIVNEQACPPRYSFLKEAKNFEISSEILKDTSKKNWPDALICVDGNFERIGDDTTQLWHAAAGRGQIDHHKISGQNVYQFRLYDPEAAATTEIVYKFIRGMNIPLSVDMAQSIYLGLIFDTGLFKHSNTRPETMRIAADLLETGFNHTETAEKGMLIRSPGAFLMLQGVLKKAQFDVDQRYVWGLLDYKTFLEAGGDSDDREGIIDLMFLTQKCEIAAFYFEPKPGQWKISFRSRGWDVAQLARSLNPDGGGHIRAAGCALVGTQNEVLGRCHEAVKKLLTSG